MTRTLLLLSTIAALAGLPLAAQETAGEAPAAETDAPQVGNIGGGLDLGEDVTDSPNAGGAPRQAGTYIKETFQDWSLQCLEVPEGEDVCQMYQLLKDANGASVAEVSIFKLIDGGQVEAGGTFVVPLETLLTQKLTIAVDSGQARRYDYSFCSQIGCFARVGLTAEDIRRFKAGAKATITLVPALAPDQRVAVTMSLSGFTAAYDAASAVRQ